MVSSTPRPHFTPGKDTVPILQGAGWAPGPVWTGGKSRPHRDSIPDRPARSSVAIPTELPGPSKALKVMTIYPYPSYRNQQSLLTQAGRGAQNLSPQQSSPFQLSSYLTVHTLRPHCRDKRCVAKQWMFNATIRCLSWSACFYTYPLYGYNVIDALDHTQ